MIRFLIFTLIVIVLLCGCTNTSTKNPTSYKHIEASALKQKLDKKEDVFLVDVHIPEQQHIKGTDLFVPYTEVEASINKFPKDKNKMIVLYCRGGNMSMEAAEVLLKNGYSNVYNLDRGMVDWLSNDYPLEN